MRDLFWKIPVIGVSLWLSLSCSLSITMAGTSIPLGMKVALFISAVWWFYVAVSMVKSTHEDGE